MTPEQQFKKREKYYFNQGYARIVLYLTNHSNANQAKNFICEDGFYLGAWFLYFRKRWQSGALDQRTVYRLELLGITIIDADDGFATMLQKYLEYVDENHTNVIPINYRTEDGCMLGAWVNRQKMCYDSLTEDKKRKLHEVGII